MKTKLNRWTLALASLGLVSLATVAQAQTATTAPAGTNAPAAASPPYGKKANMPFWKRLNEAFLEQSGTPVFTPPAPLKPGETPPPVRRIGPPPFDGPPYPTQEWQLGGGPNIIGDPGALRDAPYPLMQAIYDGPGGKAIYDSRIQLYGWETVSGNLSTSRNTALGQSANFPEVYDERPNRVEQDQFVIYLERMADQNQTDHVDWGFRLAMVAGLDYRFMSTRGFLSDQLYGNNIGAQYNSSNPGLQNGGTVPVPVTKNDYMGIDFPMMYANLYIPNFLEGMGLILGRIISEPDIEQQLAPNNLMASHSLVYGFDNYTMWGLWSTTKINSNWAVQVGIADGVDIAPWQSDPGRKATGSVLLQYIAPGGKDEIYGGMNSFNGGGWGYNNLQEVIMSYTHKFNDLWWTTFEGQYMYMTKVVSHPTYAVPYQDGFFPRADGYVPEGGIVNYTMHRLSDNTFLTFRNEWFDDTEGARTGYGTYYYEGSVGISWWVNKLLLIRPEVRFERSFSEKAYDNGTRNNQLTAAFDATFHF